MKKTIAQIAKEQGISTQAIYKRIKKLQAIATGSQPLPTGFQPIDNHILDLQKQIEVLTDQLKIKDNQPTD